MGKPTPPLYDEPVALRDLRWETRNAWEAYQSARRIWKAAERQFLAAEKAKQTIQGAQP